mgnify:CR=1 FL=1
MYSKRARLHWRQQRHAEALLDLKEAMLLAEQQRSLASGAERERADAFASHADVFETMVAWQAELGDTAEAFAAIERSRARSLLDEMCLVDRDLDLGTSSQERRLAQARQAELTARISKLEAQLANLAGKRDPAATTLREQLEKQLAAGRQALYEEHRNLRAANRRRGVAVVPAR